MFLGNVDERETKVYVRFPVQHGIKTEINFDLRASWHIAHIRLLSDSLVEISLYSFGGKNRVIRGSFHAYEARTLPALV